MAKAQVMKSRKKKRWVQIVAPKMLGSRVIGEIPVYEPEEVLHRSITSNVMPLTNDMKKQNLNMQFTVDSLVEGKAQTSITGMFFLPSAMKRFVRKGRTKISDSFICKTKDGKYVRVKPLIVSSNPVTKNVSSNIRLNARAIIQDAFEKCTYEQVVQEIFTNKLQRFVKDVVSKIYPVRTSEIRQFQIVKLDQRKIRYEKREISAELRAKVEAKNKPKVEQPAQ